MLKASLFDQINELLEEGASAPQKDGETKHSKTLRQGSVPELYSELRLKIEDYVLEMKERDPQLFEEFFIRASATPGYAKLTNLTVAMIGNGGIGNAFTELYTSTGGSNLHIFDDDTVDKENVGPQKYGLLDMGYPKVHTAQFYALMNRGKYVHAYNKRVSSYKEIREEMGMTPDVVIVGTDSMNLKNSLFEELFSFSNCVFWRNSDPSSLKEYCQTLPELLIISSMALGAFKVHVLPVRFLFKNIHFCGRDYLKIIDELQLGHTLEKRSAPNYRGEALRLDLEKQLTRSFAAREERLNYLGFDITRGDYTDRQKAAFYLWKVWLNYWKNHYYPQSEAEQEPCAARAIVYTNTVIGAYMMAFLHHYVENKFLRLDRDLKKFANFINPNSTDKDTPFKTDKFFNSKTFTETGPTRKENILRKHLTENKKELEHYKFATYLEKNYPLLCNTSTLRNYFSKNSKFSEYVSALYNQPMMTNKIFMTYDPELSMFIDSFMPKEFMSLSLDPSLYRLNEESTQPIDQLWKDEITRYFSINVVTNIRHEGSLEVSTGSEFIYLLKTAKSRDENYISVGSDNSNNMFVVKNNTTNTSEIISDALWAEPVMAFVTLSLQGNRQSYGIPCLYLKHSNRIKDILVPVNDISYVVRTTCYPANSQTQTQAEY